MLVQKLIDAISMTYGNMKGFVSIVPLLEEEFDTTKETYTLKITAQKENYTARYEIEVSRASGNMPALYLSGTGSVGSYGVCPFAYSEYQGFYTLWCSLGLFQGTSLIEQNISFTLKNSSGDTNIFNVDFPDAGARFVRVANSTNSTVNSDLSIIIEADFPIFGGPVEMLEEMADRTYYYWSEQPTYSGYVNECVYNGDYTNVDLALNAHGSQPEEINEDKIYFINNSLKVNGSIASGSSKAYRFKIDKYSRIGLYTELPHGNDKQPNMVLKISGTKPFKWNIPTNNTWTEARTLPSNAVNYQYNANNSWTDFYSGDICYANLSTNIKIFSSEEALDEYFETGDANDAINGGDDDGGKESEIGGKLDATDIPTTTPGLSGTGSYVYALSLANLKSIISDCLYVTDNDVIDALKEGLWLWGNNPIDFLIDCYYVPFSLSQFYTLGSAGVKFGTYAFPNAGTFPIVTDANGNRIVLFNTFFSRIYGDWRDFAYVSYDLYLPFLGFVPLDVNKYMDKTVKCEMMFDVTTHNLRYYLYANGIVTDRFDASVGINLPLMATDQVNKAKMDIQNTKDTVNAGINAVKALAEGNVGSSISGIMDLAQGMASVMGQKTPERVVGGFSSSMNIYDIKYAYLRITENKHLFPNNLNGVYNYPSYYIGTLDALSGYCEIEDIQLKSNCSENEYNEIKNILKGGVIF